MTELPGGARIENWTRNTIRFLAPEAGLIIDIPPEQGAPAFVDIKQEGTDYAYIHESRFWGSNLPSPREGVFLVVSPVIRLAFPDRIDLVSPIGAARNEGSVIGYQGFAR